MTDSERLAHIEATAETTAKAVADHMAAETETMQQVQTLMQRQISLTEATRADMAVLRAEGERRGVEAARDIRLVSEQVRSQGVVIAKLDERVGTLEGDHVGTRQISQHELDVEAAIAHDKITTAQQIADIRVGVSALTTALALQVPRPDGSVPPQLRKKRSTLDVLKRDNRAGVLATVLVAVYLAAQQIWTLIGGHR